MRPAAAFALLEIPMTAAEDDVRRAYARRLKSFRPDEDPEGFQRLVEARDIALAQARSRARAEAVQLRVVYGNPPDGRSPEPAQPGPPSAPEVKPAEPDSSGESASGRNAAPAGQPGEPPARHPSPPPLEHQEPPPAPHPGTPRAPENAQPPSARKSAPGGPSPARAPETPPLPEPDAAARDRDVTPADVHNALHHGLRRLVTEKKPFDVRGLEAMLLELPAGAGRYIEQAAIRQISNVLPALLSAPPFPPPAEQSLEQLAVMLTDHFGWHENDRVLFETLSPAEAARFENFLATAHKVHAPGRKTRFARLARRTAKPPTAQQKQRSSGINWGWVAFVFIALSALARIGGNHQPPVPRPAHNQSSNWLRPNLYGSDYFVQHPELLAKSMRHPQAKLVYNVDSDYKTLLAGYKARIAIKDRFPAYFIQVAADRYRKRGMNVEAVSLLDRLIASEELRPDRGALKRYRGEAWLRAYGWLNAGACLRTIHARPPDLTPEGEAHVREELREAADRAGHEPLSRSAVTARLLELADHLVRRKRSGELAALLNQLGERVSQGSLLRANLQVEIGTIRRCVLHAASSR